MISPSRYLNWLKGSKPFAVYSARDQTFNEETNKFNFQGWIDELHVSNEKLHGYLDFAKVEDGKVQEFIECKIRTHNNINLDMLIQVCFYERITNCINWKLIVYNRKYDYIPKVYTRQDVKDKYNNIWLIANNHLDFIEENYEELNKLLATKQEKIEGVL